MRRKGAADYSHQVAKKNAAIYRCVPFLVDPALCLLCKTSAGNRCVESDSMPWSESSDPIGQRRLTHRNKTKGTKLQTKHDYTQTETGIRGVWNSWLFRKHCIIVVKFQELFDLFDWEIFPQSNLAALMWLMKLRSFWGVYTEDWREITENLSEFWEHFWLFF